MLAKQGVLITEDVPILKSGLYTGAEEIENLIFSTGVRAMTTCSTLQSR